MNQALHLANGATINEKLRSDSSAAARAAATGRTDDQVLEQLYLAALSRSPTDAERQRAKTLLHEAEPAGLDPKARAIARRQAIEDLYWAMLTSKEFLFNH
jgi:hypothetical protein